MPIIPASTSTAAAYSAILPRAIGGSRVALVESGSTRPASGDRSLFPADRTKQHKPNMSIKLANGVTLPVKFVGSIVLCIISGGDVRNGHGDYSTALELRDTLYVPGRCGTLLSTKAMFK
eukprot:6194639-Pleurochrysis_carterae.AAC.1